MSYFNGTSPQSDVWSGYLAHAQTQLSGHSRLILILLVNTPLIAIVINVLGQLIIPKRATDPPTVFHWLPFIGSAIQYGNDPLNFFLQCQKKYGNVYTFILLGRRVTVALGPKGNNFVLGGKSTVFNAEDAYKHLTTPIFGKDVVYDVANDIFMEQKKFVKVGLSTENLRLYVGMIEDEVEDFMAHDPSFGTYQANDINEWGSFDVANVMGEITILTASRTLQGKEVRDNLNKGFAALYNDLDGGFTPLNWMFPNLPLESYRRRDRAHIKMSQFYVDLIKQRRTGNNDNHEHDMIAALMQQRYRSGRLLTDEEIAHMMIALLMGGQHTSSATSSWALLHLGHRPDVAEALYREQVEHFANPDGTLRPLTYEELRTLPILDSVIRETLRIHAPLHTLFRYVRDDVPVPATLGAPSKDGIYIVPKGNFTLASPAMSQIDPTIWKDGNKWEPSRWSDAEGMASMALKMYVDESGEKVDYGYGAVSKGTESPYQPFGAGKHRCIGEQFAYLQLGTLISTVIRKVELRTEKIPEHNYHTMITMPKAPRDIFYRRRKFD